MTPQGSQQQEVPPTSAFPEGFLWGAVTAAHQVEGNNLGSDFWVAEHLPGAPFAEPSGDACDHLHLYPDDIELLAGLGFNSYRFSVEWARRAGAGPLLRGRAEALPPGVRGLS